MDNKGGQWGGLAPKQVVQCPRLGAGQVGKAVLDAEGLLGPFSCFSNAGSLQTLVTAGQAQPLWQSGRPPGPRTRSCPHVLGGGDREDEASSVPRPGVRS